MNVSTVRELAIGQRGFIRRRDVGTDPTTQRAVVDLTCKCHPNPSGSALVRIERHADGYHVWGADPRELRVKRRFGSKALISQIH